MHSGIVGSATIAGSVTFTQCLCCADTGPVKDDDFCTVQERRCRAPGQAPLQSVQLRVRRKVYAGSPHPSPSTMSLFPLPSGMHKSPHVSPRRLSDISPQLRQLKYLVVDEAIKEDLKSSRSVEDINSASIEERILRITGYYGYQPWRASYTSESLYIHGPCCFVGVCECYCIKFFKYMWGCVNSALYDGMQICQKMQIQQKREQGGGNLWFSARNLNLLTNLKSAKQLEIKYSNPGY